MVQLNIIVAMTYDRVIGKDNAIPWRVPENLIPDDMRLFRETTRGNTLIMGRNTYESIGHPLPKRDNIVVSRTLPETEGIIVARTVEDALVKANSIGKPAFSIGGASIYEQTLPLADYLYISYVRLNIAGDAFFPEFNPQDYVLELRHEYPKFDYCVYRKK